MQECDESRSLCLAGGGHGTHYCMFAEVHETLSEYDPMIKIPTWLVHIYYDGFFSSEAKSPLIFRSFSFSAILYYH